MTEAQIGEILQTLPACIQDILQPWTEKSPNHPALVETSGTWTYGELAQAIAEAETLFGESGVRSGDRVMIVVENCRAFVALLLAALKLGAWAAPVNAWLSPREIDQIRDHCGARRVIYTTAVSAQARQHAKRHGAAIIEFAGAGTIGIGPLNENATAEPPSDSPPDQVAALIYTSGTTGLPKGVMLTHRNILFVAAAASQIRSITPADHVYGVLPLSHVVGFSVVLVGSLLSGATLYLAPYFDPVAAIATLKKNSISIMLGVPSMYALLAEYCKTKGLTELQIPSLRIISTSGAPLYLGLKEEIERIFGQIFYNGYGVTEASPNIAQTRIGTHRHDTSVGPLFPGIEARLVGKEGQTVANGEVGELWVRGPNIMKGYYRAPEETAAALDPEGWYNTRDLARFEGENLFIVGRSKELIVRFGFNVYPAEVEAVLNAHPAVSRSAVIGRSGEGVVGQEEVIAFVQLAPGATTTAGELAEYAAQHLAPYKCPTQILLVSTMPQTASGKILKDELAKTLSTDLVS